ncbi:MAG: GntR family transcriptional regulator [Devosia sp.]
MGVYKELRQRILDNAVPPGSHLSIKSISEEFGVSRTPIRAALARLEKEGLVELVPHQGVRILPMSADDMREIYAILGGLESAAVDAIFDTPAPDLSPMAAALTAMERALEEDNLADWAIADEAFHEALVALSGNRRLEELVAQYRSQSHRARMTTLRLRPTPMVSTKHHRAVFEAIRDGDRDRARELHARQRIRSARELVDILQQLNLRHL